MTLLRYMKGIYSHEFICHCLMSYLFVCWLHKSTRCHLRVIFCCCKWGMFCMLYFVKTKTICLKQELWSPLHMVHFWFKGYLTWEVRQLILLLLLQYYYITYPLYFEVILKICSQSNPTFIPILIFEGILLAFTLLVPFVFYKFKERFHQHHIQIPSSSDGPTTCSGGVECHYIDWVDFLTQGLQKLNSCSKAQIPSSHFLSIHRY